MKTTRQVSWVRNHACLIGSLGLAAAALISLPSVAQTCAWGAASTAEAPTVTSLRSEHAFVDAPVRVAVDSGGSVYTADAGRDAVFVTDSHGRLVGTLERLLQPVSVAVDESGNVYVGEGGAGAVSVFDPRRNPSRRLGAGAGEFLLPNDIAIDPDPENRSVYVSDGLAHVIKVYDSHGDFSFSFGGKGASPGQLNFPSAVHVSRAGEVYVADQNNDRVQVFDRSGRFVRCFGANGLSGFSTRFGRLAGITSDAQGRVYVADAFHGHIKVFDAHGAELAMVGGFGQGHGDLRTPAGLAIDPSNRLWVASVNWGRLELFGLDDFADPHVIDANIEGPDSLNRRRPPEFISVVVEIPGVTLSQLDLTSFTANGVPAAGVGSRQDADRDGIPDLTVRFPGTLLAALPDGESTLVVAGELLAGGIFEGQATVLVLAGSPGRTGLPRDGASR